MGGLCTAFILSKAGYKVCVLEKNRQFGGNLQVFSRSKNVFDTGVHYLGGLAEGQNLNQCFKYFGLMDKLKLIPLDINGYDQISFEGDSTIYKHAQGYPHFVHTLSKTFPEEKNNLTRYVQKIKEICDAFPLYRLQAKKIDAEIFKYLETDVQTFLESISPNSKLQRVLAGTNLLYAGEAHKTPLYVHALVVNSFIESAWRCEGGSGQIAKHLVNSVREMGGTVLPYSEAVKFHFLGEEIKEVELANGPRIQANHFIANIDLNRLVGLMDPEHIPPSFKARIQKLETSASAFLVYLSLKPGTLAYFNYNRYHYLSDDVWNNTIYSEESWPKMIALFPQIKAGSHEHTDSLIVMTYMHYEEMKSWLHTKNIQPNHSYSRGKDYEAFKNRKTKKIIETVEKILPGITKNLIHTEAATPLTQRDYIGSEKGNLYGFQKDYQNPLGAFFSPRTPIANLWLCGQNVSLHGILGVTLSAIECAGEFIDREKLLKDIRSAD